jgi:hypothetical protein
MEGSSLFCLDLVVLFELSSITGNEAKTEVFCKSRVRVTPVSVFFLKTPTQNLKV